MCASVVLIVAVLVGPAVAVREAKTDKEAPVGAVESLIKEKLRHTDVPTARPVTYETDAVKRVLWTAPSFVIDTYGYILIGDHIWFTPRSCEPDVTPHLCGIAIR
jgi:hypothetical protein